LADATRVRLIMDPTLPAGSTVEFRLTSLDVTHGFGLYDPNRQIIAQTEAMPRCVTRLPGR
jgi:cytochrome c oxidase subunit 2